MKISRDPSAAHLAGWRRRKHFRVSAFSHFRFVLILKCARQSEFPTRAVLDNIETPLIMFDFSRKKQPAFGVSSADDDRNIEIHRMRRESRNGIWTESLRLLRDIVFVLAIFILLGVF